MSWEIYNPATSSYLTGGACEQVYDSSCEGGAAIDPDFQDSCWSSWGRRKLRSKDNTNVVHKETAKLSPLKINSNSKTGHLRHDEDSREEHLAEHKHKKEEAKPLPTKKINAKIGADHEKKKKEFLAEHKYKKEQVKPLANKDKLAKSDSVDSNRALTFDDDDDDSYYYYYDDDAHVRYFHDFFEPMPTQRDSSPVVWFFQ